MKRKGFTLIELLAVIVILAITALIAVPVIMNIIASARKSAFEDTAYGLISAGEMYYAGELLENGMTSDVEFTIEDGEFVGTNKLEVKGALPTSGKIKVTRDGKVALAISNGVMCITKGYDDSKIDPEADVDNCELPAEPAKTLSELAKTNDFVASVDACATSGECAVGTKFAIEVAPGEIKNFYVVSDIDNKVTLIMDRNVDEETVAWIQKEDYPGTEEEWGYGNTNKGPTTALNYLEDKTSGWTNLEAKDYILVDDQGQYTITRTGARARMLTYTEAERIIYTYNWSYANGIYWVSSSHGSESSWCVSGGGFFHQGVGYDYGYGVRPVIELSK